MAKPYYAIDNISKPLIRYPDEKQRWYAVVVRGRFERKADRYLKSINIECYLPLQKRISYWSDRKKWIETPLFPSYIFVNVNNKDYSRVFACPHILKYVSFEGQPLPVPTDQLNLIKAVIRSDMNYVAIKENFKKGDRVKLLEGPLADYYGVVMTYSGKENIVISLENIGYALLINMPAECMAAANTL